MLKIWGRLNSANVKKVVWAAQELALPFERIDVGGPFGGVNTPQFLALNPNGTIPVLEDDGFVLWESNAIVRYLASQYGDGSLYPADVRQRADIERWLDWQTTTFHPALVPAFLHLVRLPAAQRQPELAQAARPKLEQLAALLDAQLAERAYLTGNSFTIADLVLGCSVHPWLNLPLERVERPHLQRWYQALRARPASAGVLTLPLS
jgi:glutathione S-transferase